MIFILIYINKLDTDVSWLILLIASPSNGAIVSCFIFLATLIASVAKIESVVTSEFRGEEATFDTAPPDKTPCVAQSGKRGNLQFYD